MSPSRLVRPILGASSRRRLIQQLASTPNGVTPSCAKLAFGQRASTPPTRLSCGPVLGRRQQLRFSSTDSSEPRKPPSNYAKPETRDASPVPPSEPPSEPLPESPSKPQPAPSLPPNENLDLPSHTESRRSQISTRFTQFMDRAQSSLFAASQRINDLTGYSGIETLKSQIAVLETSLADAQSALHAARSAYKAKVADRSATQREVTTLLARQKTWTPADFERFTGLYRADYELEADVAERARDLEEAEREAERLGRELSTAILARYHEEQIWSDKIRRMSTWGTWGLMGVNVLLFLVFQFGAEPWRRARLVKGFEEKVRQAMEQERAKDRIARREELEAATATTTPTPAALLTAETVPDANVAGPDLASPADEIPHAKDQTPVSWHESLTNWAWWKEAAIDLTSERPVAIRMRDLSLIALEGVAAGAAIACTIAMLSVRRA